MSLIADLPAGGALASCPAVLRVSLIPAKFAFLAVGGPVVSFSADFPADGALASYPAVSFSADSPTGGALASCPTVATYQAF